jgi:hypothetical protein
MTFDEAIAAEILLASGLPAGKVLWAYQTVDRPALPYVCLTPLAINDKTWWPELNYSNNPSGVPGNPTALPPIIGTELNAVLVLEHLPSVRIEYFCASITGASTARESLHGVLHQLLFPDSRSRLRSSATVFIDNSPVTTVPALVGSRFESRAATTSYWRYVETLKKTETYIGSVTISGQLPDAGHAVNTTVSTEPS